MNKIIAFVGFLVLVNLIMYAVHFCPPQGPWPKPPWCKQIETPSAPLPSTSPIASPTQTPLPTATPTPTVDIENIKRSLSMGVVVPSKSYTEDYPINEVSWAWTFNYDWWALNKSKENGIRFISTVSIWNRDGWDSENNTPKDLLPAVCVDINGKRMYTQDMLLFDITHPAWFEFQKEHIRKNIDAGADGFVFDEYYGTNFCLDEGGTFNEHNVIGFRNYLKNKYSEKELEEMGITNIETFNYSEFLHNNGYAENWTRFGSDWRVKEYTPLAKDFKDYINNETRKAIVELAEYAKSYGKSKGKNILLSFNTFNLNPTDLYMLPYADYLSYEHVFFSDADPPGRPVSASCKMARAIIPTMHRILVAIDDYKTLAKVKEGTKLARMLGAETFASGCAFVWFDIDWLGIKFSANYSHFKKLPELILNHPELFTYKDSTAKVGVIYSIDSILKDWDSRKDIRGILEMLIENNVQFDVLFSYDALNKHLPNLQKYNIILLPNTVNLSSEDENILKSFKGTTVCIGECSFDANIKINETLGRQYYNKNQNAKQTFFSLVSLPNETNLMHPIAVFSYFNGTSLILHIVNRDFDQTLHKKTNLNVKYKLPDGFKPKEAIIYSPEGNETANISITENYVEFTLNNLNDYAVAELK